MQPRVVRVLRMLLRQELEEKLRSQTKELASEQRSASAVKRALASARDELAAAQAEALRPRQPEESAAGC